VGYFLDGPIAESQIFRNQAVIMALTSNDEIKCISTAGLDEWALKVTERLGKDTVYLNMYDDLFVESTFFGNGCYAESGPCSWKIVDDRYYLADGLGLGDAIRTVYWSFGLDIDIISAFAQECDSLLEICTNDKKVVAGDLSAT
jgi:hypothetical protein